MSSTILSSDRYETVAPARLAIASIEPLFVSFVNSNADRIKLLAAFKRMSKEQMLNLKSEYLAARNT